MGAEGMVAKEEFLCPFTSLASLARLLAETRDELGGLRSLVYSARWAARPTLLLSRLDAIVCGVAPARALHGPRRWLPLPLPLLALASALSWTGRSAVWERAPPRGCERADLALSGARRPGLRSRAQSAFGGAG